MAQEAIPQGGRTAGQLLLPRGRWPRVLCGAWGAPGDPRGAAPAAVLLRREKAPKAKAPLNDLPSECFWRVLLHCVLP